MSSRLGDETALARHEVAYVWSSRWIVELCHNSLIQAFPFLIERFESVTLAPRRAISRGWRRYRFRLAQSQLVDNLSAVSQIRRKDQPILAPSQRTMENVEFLLIVRLGSTRLPSFLECRLPFFAIS